MYVATGGSMMVAIHKTLFAVQTLDIPEYVGKFKTGLKNRVLAVKELVPDAETRKLYNRTGLGIASNVKAKEAANKIKPTLSKLEDVSRLPREFWFEIHDAMKDITEVSELARLESKLLADWVDGAEYKNLADEYYEGNLERVAKEIETATFSFPWGLHAIVQHLTALVPTEAIPSLVTNSPSLVYHGVPTMAAVYAMNLGVYDRRLAIRIADTYLKEHGSTSFGQVKDWLQGIDYTSWAEMLKGNDQNAIDECYGRIKAKESTEQSEVVLEFNLSDLQPVEKIGDEDLIVVRYKEDYWLCTYDYRRIGKLSGENLSRLRDVDRRNRDLIVEDFDKTTVSVRIL